MGNLNQTIVNILLFNVKLLYVIKLTLMKGKKKILQCLVKKIDVLTFIIK